MTGSTSPRGGLRWWAAMPDTTQAAAPVSAVLSAAGEVLARHRSGRPWIVGNLPPGELHQAEAPGGPLAVLGELLATRRELAQAAALGPRGVLALPGSFQLAQSSAAGITVWTDPVGYRRVFTASVSGVPVVAEQAGPLAELLGADLDPVWLAARLCSPDLPGPLAETRTAYRGVRPAPAGHRLDLPAHGGPVRTAAWWTPPEPDLDLTAGAELLRAALLSAVTRRVRRAGGPVSVQLSGGLDSAALAILAHQAGPDRLLLATVAGCSPANRDHEWARRAAAVLPGAEHQVYGPDQVPAFFDSLPAALPVLDEPVNHAAGAARARHTARRLAEAGSVRHLNGQGGDEVLAATLAYLPALLRRSPRLGWRHLRGQAALRDIHLGQLTRAVLAPASSYPAWMRSLDLRRPPRAAAAALAWETAPALPRWVTSRAAATVTVEAVLAASDSPYERATHATLTRIRTAARRAALYGRAQQLDGLAPAFPFLDRQVVEAALRVTPWQRTDPYQPKPLLTAAVAPLAAPGVLTRRDKSHYTADIYAGWRAHRRELGELLAEPILADLDLIDRDQLAAAVHRFAVDGTPPAELTTTLAVELWLGARTRGSESR
jgi:asparagine synthase (glutamine-hydrolysing)